MCTVTWKHLDAGYHLFFNRDELRTRLTAYPPQIHETNGVRIIAPVDADAGGTWLGANELGVTVGLVNYFPHDWQRFYADGVRYESRGHLVFSLLDAGSVSELEARVDSHLAARYRPFILIGMDPRRPPFSWQWDGTTLSGRSLPEPPLTTSSQEPEGVEEHRIRLYREMVNDGRGGELASLERYHRSQIPRPGPYSVAMEREEAQTVSMSRISVTEEEVVFQYTPGNPARTEPSPPLRLPRSRRT